MREKIAKLKLLLEGTAEKHRDAYNQALGGLHVIDELMKKDAPQAMTEEELARSLGAQSLSFEPLKREGGD